MLTIFIRLLSLLPLGVLHAIGGLLGRVVLAVSPSYRQALVDNLAQAGYDRDDRALIRRAATEAGRGVLELAYVWMRPQGEVLERVAAVGTEHVEAARRTGRGIVFLTPHLGCFEITAQYLAHEAPLTVLYRPPRKAWLAPLVEGARARGSLRLAPANLTGVRLLAKALKRGEAIGMLPDQVPSRGEGVWAHFFGKPAYTMTLPARLAQMQGATLLLVHGERLADSRGWTVHFAPVETPPVDDPVAAATQINAALERQIRTIPAQYLWGYNRYKKPASAPDAPVFAA